MQPYQRDLLDRLMERDPDTGKWKPRRLVLRLRRKQMWWPFRSEQQPEGGAEGEGRDVP